MIKWVCWWYYAWDKGDDENDERKKIEGRRSKKKKTCQLDSRTGRHGVALEEGTSLGQEWQQHQGKRKVRCRLT